MIWQFIPTSEEFNAFVSMRANEYQDTSSTFIHKFTGKTNNTFEVYLLFACRGVFGLNKNIIKIQTTLYNLYTFIIPQYNEIHTTLSGTRQPYSINSHSVCMGPCLDFCIK